jgi:hypothetical protein
MFELKEAVVSVGAADVFSGCSATAGVACCSFYLRFAVHSVWAIFCLSPWFLPFVVSVTVFC